MRSFIAAAWLFAAVINGAMWYRPAPVVAAPVKVASWLKADKLPGRVVNPPWPERIIQTESYRLDPHVAAVTATPERGLPWSCEAIRNAVANLTTQQIERLARIYRLSAEQRAEARRCLKGRA